MTPLSNPPTTSWPPLAGLELSTEPALDAAWDAYCRWDSASIARKRRLDWSRGIIFMLLAGAAISGVIASELKIYPWIAGISAACSAAAALLAREAVGPAVERLWLVARAAAETLKSEAFKYAAGVEPCQISPTSRSDCYPLSARSRPITLPARRRRHPREATVRFRRQRSGRPVPEDAARRPVDLVRTQSGVLQQALVTLARRVADTWFVRRSDW